MRTIKRTAQFKRDYKREKQGQHRVTLDNKLFKIIQLLVIDAKLPESIHDHFLTGKLKDCHIKPDLILIYRKINDDTLELLRLGSHRELGF